MNVPKDTKGAAAAREAGNASYKKGKWAEAIGHYAQAARLDPTDPAPLLNRAQAYLKLEKWQDVVRDCNTVLGLPSHSQNIKALFRRSLARRELGEEEQAGAVQDLETILKLEPSNSAAKEELASLKKELEKNNKKKKKERSKPAKVHPKETLTEQEEDEPKPVVPPLSLAPSSTRRISTPKPPVRPDPPHGVQLPIKVVPFFTPRPSLIGQGKTAEAGPSRSLPGDDARDGSKATNGSSGGFAEKKAGRGSKKSFTGLEPASTSKSVEEADLASRATISSGSASGGEEVGKPGVIPPVSGLDMIDRVMHSATHEKRWDILTAIPPAKACVWLDPLIEPDHLATIYQALLSSTTGGEKGRANTERARELVHGLKGMNRWKMVQGLLSKKEKEVLRQLNEQCRLE